MDAADFYVVDNFAALGSNAADSSIADFKLARARDFANREISIYGGIGNIEFYRGFW